MLKPLFSLPLCLVLFGSTAAAQTVADPYLPGMRWSYGSQTTKAWIPRDVCFAGDEDLAWVGKAVENPGVGLFGAALGGPATELFDVPLPGAIGQVMVAAGDGLDELFLAAQFPGPLGKRVTEVQRQSAFPGGTSWTRSLGPVLLGGVELAASEDGSRLFVARFDPQASRVYVDRLDVADGGTLKSSSFSAPALRGLSLDEAGEHLLVGLGSSMRLLDADLQLVTDVPLAGSTEAFAISDDGSAFAFGQNGEVQLWRDVAGTWQAAEKILVPGTWMATSLDLDATGDTLGVGWWDFTTGASILFQMWDLAGGNKLHELLQSTPGTGLQNYPEEVCVSADGTRMALGAWGSGGPDPQLILLDRALPQPIYSAYLSGSVLGLDLDRPGGRVAVAVKGSHANQFATTGFVQVYDLGERDLLALGPLTSPGVFHFSSREPGNLASLFVFGSEQPKGPFPGVAGLLGIDPYQPFSILAAPADSSGRADLFGPVPADPALPGFQLSLQGIFSTPQGWSFSQHLTRFTIL
ncbi:MAG: hypothetical protein P1V81_00740 [Planctomycetota bacterium]|nr:hypothetical protein [Planctomycetota bacterium]